LNIKSQIGKTLRLPFVKNVIHTIGSKWITIAIGIIPVMLITRGLGPVGKGEYSLIISTIGVLMQLSTFGLHTSNTYHVSKDRSSLDALFTNSVFWIAVTATLTSLGFFLFNLLYPGEINMFKGGYIGFIVIGTFGSLSNIISQNLNIGINNIKQVNVYTIGAKVLTLVLVLSLYFSKNITVRYALIIALLEFFVITFLCGRLLMRSIEKITWTIDKELLRKTISYGLKVYIISLMAFLVVRSDIYIVKYFLGNEAVGYYSTSVQLIDQLNMLAVVVATLLLPKLTSTEDLKERHRLSKRSFKYLAILMFTMCTIGFFFSDFAIKLLFGVEFMPASITFKVLLPAIFFLALETSLAQYLAANGLPKSLIWAWIATFIINLILNVLFIPIYGTVGAAYASVISYFSIFVFVYIIYRRGIVE